jgi:hypothetical protein
MLKFHWHNYPFEKGKRYLIIFPGNFCPPHKGHFNLLAPFLDLIENYNLTILIYPLGFNRHNVPLEISLEIWDIYIKSYFEKVTNSSNNIFISQKDIYFTEMFRLIKERKINRILFLASDDHLPQGEIENTYLHSTEALAQALWKKDLLLEYLFINRIPNYSSTALCSVLNFPVDRKVDDSNFPVDRKVDDLPKTNNLNFSVDRKVDDSSKTNNLDLLCLVILNVELNYFVKLFAKITGFHNTKEKIYEDRIYCETHDGQNGPCISLNVSWSQ